MEPFVLVLRLAWAMRWCIAPTGQMRCAGDNAWACTAKHSSNRKVHICSIFLASRCLALTCLFCIAQYSCYHVLWRFHCHLHVMHVGITHHYSAVMRQGKIIDALMPHRKCVVNECFCGWNLTGVTRHFCYTHIPLLTCASFSADMRFLQCMHMCVLLRPREVCFPTMCCWLIVDLDTLLWRNLKLYLEHGS